MGAFAADPAEVSAAGYRPRVGFGDKLVEARL